MVAQACIRVSHASHCPACPALLSCTFENAGQSAGLQDMSCTCPALLIPKVQDESAGHLNVFWLAIVINFG